MGKSFEFPEGATPLFDCSGLIPLWVHNLNDLNRVEAENIMHAHQKYLRPPVSHPKKWFQVEALKAIHKAMFGKVWEWAGVYRKSVTSIGVKPVLIPMLLAEFCREVLSWFHYPVELTFVEMSARIHHRLVFIHPFENGNGRFSRLIADRFLLFWKCPYPLWPNHLNQEGVVRRDYVQTLKDADRGNYTSLIDFMKKFGASDPKPDEFLKNKFYETHLKDEKGRALLAALLKHGNNHDTSAAHRKP